MSTEGSPRQAEVPQASPKSGGQRDSLPGATSRSPECSLSEKAESGSLSKECKGHGKAGSAMEAGRKRAELDGHRAEDHPRKRHCSESSPLDQDGQRCNEFRRWDELLSDIDTLRKVDAKTFLDIMKETLSAAAPYPDVVRNLSQALVLYSTDKEASLKLLDETKSAQSLLFMAYGSDDSRNVVKAGNRHLPMENHRNRTPGEGIADRVRSSSEQSVVSEEKSWQDILRKATDTQDVTEAGFNQSLQAALHALRSNKNGSDSSVVMAVERLLDASGPLQSRIQGTRRLLDKHFNSHSPQPQGARVESVHMKAGVDCLNDMELRLLLQGWKKEISLDDSNGQNTIVAHYIHSSGKKRLGSLADVRTLLGDGHIPGPSGDAASQDHEDPVGCQIQQHFRPHNPATSGSLLASLSFPRATPESLGLAACLAGSQHDNNSFRSSMRPLSGIQSIPASTSPVLTTVLSRTPYSSPSDGQFVPQGVRLVAPQPRQVLQVVNPIGQDAQPHVVKIPANGAVPHAQAGAHSNYVVQQSPRGGGRFTIDADGRRGQQVVVIPNHRILNHTEQQPILRVFPQKSSEHSGQRGVARMVQPYPGNSPVFRTDGRLHPPGQSQQSNFVSHTDIGQSLNDSLHKDSQSVRLQQTPQPVMIREGRDLVLLSPSSYNNRSSQQHRMQTQPHHHQHLHQQQQQLQGARASLTSNALAGSQIIQTRNDQLIVLPKASSSLSVMQSKGVSVWPAQAGDLHFEPGTHGLNVMMAPARSRPGKGTLVNMQAVQEAGSQGNKFADRRHGSAAGADSAGNAPAQLVHVRAPGGGNSSLLQRGQINRQLGGDHSSEIRVLDSATVSRATAEEKLSRQTEGGRGGAGSSMSNIQKLLRVPASDRHQSKQGTPIVSSSEPAQAYVPAGTRASTPVPVVITNMSEGPSAIDGRAGVPRISSNSARVDTGTMLNGVQVLVQIPAESDGNVHQANGNIQGKSDLEIEHPDGIEPEDREQCDVASSPEAEMQDYFNWKCILSSKPTPQRLDMELFTVVGHIDQDLIEKLPDRMTVEEFEAQDQVDCWPTEETISLHLDEETSERGKHALKRLSDMRLAAIVHLPNFDFVFVPQTQNGDSSLLGLVKTPRVKEEVEEEEDEGSEEGMNNIHGS